MNAQFVKKDVVILDAPKNFLARKVQYYITVTPHEKVAILLNNWRKRASLFTL